MENKEEGRRKPLEGAYHCYCCGYVGSGKESCPKCGLVKLQSTKELVRDSGVVTTALAWLNGRHISKHIRDEKS